MYISIDLKALRDCKYDIILDKNMKGRAYYGIWIKTVSLILYVVFCTVAKKWSWCSETDISK